MAVPVMADSMYDPWIDISEVCTVNDTGTNYFSFYGKTTVTLNSGFSTIVGQIDMIWFCGYGAPTNVYLWRSNSSSTRLKLTIQNIGGSYYRIYGNVGNYTLSEYKFDIETGTTGYRSYEIKSCRIAESLATYGLDYGFSVEPGASSEVTYYTAGAEIHPYSSLGLPSTSSYIWQITPQNWNAYDYIDVHISTSSASIGSITVMHNGRSLPYEITNIYTLLETDFYNDLGTQETPGQPSISAILHIDISSISRLSGVAPLITIEGNWNTMVGAYLEVYSIVAYIAPTERTGVAYWFEKGKDFLSDLFGVGEGQESVDDLEQGSTSISDGAADIGSFEESQQDTLNSGFATITSGISFTSFSAALLFVQKYANMTFNGISRYAIIFTLPLFLGLFFYLCSRIPGITRWKPRPPQSKGGKNP